MAYIKFLLILLIISCSHTVRQRNFVKYPTWRTQVIVYGSLETGKKGETYIESATEIDAYQSIMPAT